MPNYVTNIISLTGDKEKIKNLINSITSEEDGEIGVDFNKIIPMPESLNVESGSNSESLIGLYLYYENGDVSRISKWKPRDESIEEYVKKRHEICNYTKEKAQVYIDNMKNYGAPTWYEWCINNWGTKWNAMRSEISEDRIVFDTAWDGVPDLLSIVSKNNPDIIIDYLYADEDWGCNVGSFQFRAGNAVYSEIPENCSERAREIAEEVLGPNPYEDYDEDEED